MEIPLAVNERQALLQLARAAAKLWESQRVVRCWHLGQQHPSLRLVAALAVFRERCGPGQDAADVVAAVKPQLKGMQRRLALVVHPDKAPPELPDKHAEFEEAFKALLNAYELLS